MNIKSSHLCKLVAVSKSWLILDLVHLTSRRLGGGNIGVVVHACNSGIGEVKTGGFPKVQESLGYTVRLCLKRKGVGE